MSAAAKRCPSELTLEAHLLEPSPQVTAHAARCVRCTERIARMEREGEDFRRFVLPATRDAVVDSVRRPRHRFWMWAVPLPAAAAAVLAVALLLPRAPSESYLGTKGGGLGLGVFAASAAGAHPVADGERVAADAALRFEVRATAPCRLWIASVDGAGQVSRLFPPAGDAGEAIPAGGAEAMVLPGGAVLDGRTGPERLYAVCAPGPLPWAAAARAVREAAGGGDAVVRAPRPLRGLPAGTREATLLVEKAR